jgi:hypothetical protein
VKSTLGIRDWGLGIRSVTGVALILASVTLSAQTKPANPARPTNQTNPVNPNEAVLPPIECWWKTDRNAVWVGETFLLTLTCAVLDTERVKVVVDETSLEPSALHLTPFEIVGGQRFRDVPNAPRRFFQYQYSVRPMGEELFGREVTLPRLQIGYRVQNSLQGGAALQGREAQYSLVPVPIRVLSLVPPGTTDIRDTSVETFGDVEARLFRSNLLFILGSVALTVAVLLAIMLVARAAYKHRAATAVRQRTLSPFSVVHAALRELATVRSASQGEGWTSDLAGRAAAAVRLALAVALGGPIGQREVDRSSTSSEGQISAASPLGLLRGKKFVLSSAATPETAPRNGHHAAPQLSQALKVFTAARYARNGDMDGTALDAALADAADAAKRLRTASLLRFGRRRQHHDTHTARQSWAR